jgi:phospholipid/cholesterol/gamma-HCH transport system substrate-binding protein
MAKWEDRDSRFRRLEIKTGLLVLIALTGVVLLVIFLGVERGYFTKKFSIHFVTDSISGLSKGMPVKLSGFKIGRVKGFEFIEGAKVKVTAVINRKHQMWLRAGSKARLSKVGYIGESYIEITVGDSGGPLLDEGDLIPYEITGGVEEIIKEALPVLDEVREIIHYINDPEGDIKVTIGNIRDLSSDLLETKAQLQEGIADAAGAVKKLNSIVGKFDEKGEAVMNSAKRAFENIEEMSMRFAPTMEKIELIAGQAEEATRGLPETARKIEGIVDDVKVLTGGLADNAPGINRMISDAEEAASGGKEIVRGVKKSWPVRLMLPPKKVPELVPLDSFLLEREVYGLD